MHYPHLTGNSKVCCQTDGLFADRPSRPRGSKTTAIWAARRRQRVAAILDTLNLRSPIGKVFGGARLRIVRPPRNAP